MIACSSLGEEEKGLLVEERGGGMIENVDQIGTDGTGKGKERSRRGNKRDAHSPRFPGEKKVH